MASKKLKFINGHFYDTESGKRISLKDNIEVSISSDDKNFIPAKPAGNVPKKILNEEQKKLQVGSDKKVKDFKKVFSAGKILYFHFPKKDAWFKAEILEDLYLFLNQKTKKNEG